MVAKFFDKINTKQLLNNVNMMSVNQINAQIKLTEMWKSVHWNDYPLNIERQSSREERTNTRANTTGIARLKI